MLGYVGHVHIPDARRTKLEDKSMSCVLLGVSDESKGYRLYDPIAKKIIVSLDVIFEEESQWNWDASYDKELLMDLEWEDGGYNTREEEKYEENIEEEEVKVDESKLNMSLQVLLMKMV